MVKWSRRSLLVLCVSVLFFVGRNQFHASLLGLSKLISLDLSDSNLTEIPSKVLNIVSLEYLNLAKNKNLKQLPDRFIDLKNLKELNIIHTPIQIAADAEWQNYRWILNGEPVRPTFPEILLKMPKLKKLWISRFADYFSDAQLDLIIKKKLDVRNADGDTLMMYAAGNHNIELLSKLMLAYPWMLNLLVANVTPLIMALRGTRVVPELTEDSFDTVKYLLSHRADPNLGAPLVELAAGVPSELRLKIFRLLLKKGAKINQVDSFGNTVLIQVANWGNKDLVTQALLGGVKVDAHNKFGETALSKLLRSDHGTLADRKALVDLLLSKGAKAREQDIRYVFDKFFESVKLAQLNRSRFVSYGKTAEQLEDIKLAPAVYKSILSKLSSDHQAYVGTLVSTIEKSLIVSLSRLVVEYEMVKKVTIPGSTHRQRQELARKVSAAESRVDSVKEVIKRLNALKSELAIEHGAFSTLVLQNNNVKT